MKHLIDKSKKHILDKLKWFSSILDVLASIFKSFAMIIGSLFAGIVASVTGYHEVKKALRSEKHSTSKTETSSHPSEVAGEANITMSTTSTRSVETNGYQLDMNSGAFLLSMVMLGVMLFKKLKKGPISK